jgi:V/A-type H+-transporting ATPase subunit E
MTGLDKILKQIEEEAAANAAKEIASANEKVSEILASAKEEAEKKCAAIAEQSKIDMKSALSRGESAANLCEKKMVLKAKQEIIGDIIEQSKKTLGQLPDNEYFDIILKMIEKHALDKEGQILFKASDIKRMPEKFNDSIKDGLKEKKNANLTIGESLGNLDGGFILTYGDIEINCSFESLFLSARERLQDKVCEALFV